MFQPPGNGGSVLQRSNMVSNSQSDLCLVPVGFMHLEKKSIGCQALLANCWSTTAGQKHQS